MNKYHRSLSVVNYTHWNPTVNFFHKATSAQDKYLCPVPDFTLPSYTRILVQSFTSMRGPCFKGQNLLKASRVWHLSSNSSRNFSRLQKVQSVQAGDRLLSRVYAQKLRSVGSMAVIPNIAGMSTRLNRLDRTLEG